MTNHIGKLFSAAGKLATQAVRAGVSAINKLANEQEFQAVIAACVLIATADGKSDDAERIATLNAATAHPSLKDHTQADIQKAFTEMHTILGFDKITGVEALLEKIKKVTDLEGRARIIGIATAVANADGDFSTSEKAMVERIRNLK